MRRINSRHIEVFQAVMQCGTTTAAARMLHTTQPAVSRTLAQLQWASGIRLFDNPRGRLLPTAEARELYEIVSQHFLGLEKIEETITTLKQAGTGLLRIACTPVLGLSIMPGALRSFQQAYPGVRITMETLGTLKMRSGLFNGDFDVVFSTSDIRMAGLEPTIMHNARSVCVMSRNHELASAAEVHVTDLQRYPLICHHKEDAQQQLLKGLLQKFGVQPPAVLETNQSSTICCIAAEGVGVGIVASFCAAVFSSLVHIAPFVPVIVVQTQMAYSPVLAPSQLAKAFVDCVSAHLNELDAVQG